MKYIVPTLAGLGSAASMIAMLFVIEGALMSARCTVDAMSGAVVIVVALVMAASSADAIMVTRRRMLPLVESLPARARLSLVRRRITNIWLGAVLGMGAAIVFGLTCAWVLGSPPSWEAVVIVPLMMLVVGSFAIVGWAVGALGKSWFIPPVMVVAEYAAVAMNFGYARTAIVLFGGYPPSGSYTVPNGAVYFSGVGFYSALALVGIAGIFWWVFGKVKFTFVLSVLSVIALVVSIFLMGDTVGAAADKDELFVVEDSNNWQCSQAHGSRICIPPDQGRDLPLLMEDLPMLHHRLLQIDTSLASRIWLPVNSPRDSALVYALPLGSPLPARAQAREAAYGLASSCIDQTSQTSDDEKFDFIFDQAEALYLWLAAELPLDETELGSDVVVSLADAKTAYDRIVKC